MSVIVQGPAIDADDAAWATSLQRASNLSDVENATTARGNIGAETALGNPGANGHVLSSTTLGVRSWVAAGGSTASMISNVPAGTIAAVTVQAALNELDTEKAALSGATFTGNVSLSNSGAALSIGDASGFPTLKMRGSLTALLSTDVDLQLGSGYSTVSARAPFTARLETAGTNDVIIGTTIQRLTSGTPAAGLGTKIQFQVEGSTVTGHAAADIIVTTIDPTNATRVMELGFGVYYGAYPGTYQEVVAMQSASGAPKLSFFGGAPQSQSTGWAVENVTAAKTFDANSTSIDEIADVLGTLITYLIARGDLAA